MQNESLFSFTDLLKMAVYIFLYCYRLLTFLYSLAHSNGASVLITQLKLFLSIWQVNSMLSNPMAAVLISNSWLNQDLGQFITLSFLKRFPSQLCDTTVTEDLQGCPYPVSLASSSHTSFMTFLPLHIGAP